MTEPTANKFDIDKFEEIVSEGTVKDEILVWILFRIATKLCRKENESYVFGTEDETDENGKYILQYSALTKKIIPQSNPAYLPSCNKKIYVYLRHVCKHLSHLGITLTTKQENYYKDDIKTTKTKHSINGLI